MTLPLSYSRLGFLSWGLPPTPRRARSRGANPTPLARLPRCRSVASLLDHVRRSHTLSPLDLSVTRPPTSEPRSGESSGGEGRTRTFEGARPTDLQSAAFDRFATSPMRCVDETAPLADLSLEAHAANEGGKLAKGFEPPTG